MTKTNTSSSLARVSELLQVISPEPRLEILLAIGTGEACVCHLEAILGYRQAYISQQLMALREAGLLDSRRDGKYNFYRLAKTGIFELLQNAAQIAEANLIKREPAMHKKQCACPHCAPAFSNSILVEPTH
ncbi:MAG: metalloregulator ArsR/SmtB family transcription factor [Chloroflexi bacterium]|nr:metalloregulator ArsR/SmtB family transcription factor [Chloroflexota bacterium]